MPEGFYHTGGVRHGIDQAGREGKSVVCFVRDDGPESAMWENDFLFDPEVMATLTAGAIVLRLDLHSSEAMFLAVLSPRAIEQAPAVVLLQTGRIQLFLYRGITKAQFKTVVIGSLEGRPPTAVAAPPGEPAAPATSAIAPVVENRPPVVANRAPSYSHKDTQTETPLPTAEASILASPATTAGVGTSSATAERTASARSTDTQSSSTARAASRVAKGKSVAEEVKSPTGTAAVEDAKRAAEIKYALIRKKREQEARNERERILRLVEHDRRERKEREDRRKGVLATNEGREVAPKAAGTKHAPSEARECALQVRLLDGTTIRSRFPSTQTLREDVRQWVDENRRGDDTPYNFKQILAPLPNRMLSISEEEESLHSLGLTPNATLVLSPIQNPATSAYGQSTSGNVVSRSVSFGYSTVTSGVGLVAGTLGGLLGVGSTAPSADEPSSSRTGTPAQVDLARGPSGINVRTLHDQRGGHGDRQFYNGNQLNFEPNERDEAGDGVEDEDEDADS
ncbi:MAG: hypothetical protein M1838_000263 [Thelocarpon superellum]|nr:MAG: hypothetical protein M1838_000263 [Thelocarpon superellum]